MGKAVDGKQQPKIQVPTTTQAGKASKPEGKQKTPSKPTAAAADEIEAIFGKAKNKQEQPGYEQQGKNKEQGLAANGPAAAAAAAQGKKTPGAAADSGSKKKPRIGGSKDDIFGAETGKGRKKTEEGFSIYTEDELGLGKRGGDTDLCPFDCDCCF